MIRFVDLGHQLGVDSEDPRMFAFFDTTTDTFVSFQGVEAWESMADFCLDFNMLEPIERFTSKIPASWPK